MKNESEAERWEALARYLSGESPPEELAAIERWLAEDPAHAEMLSTLASAIGRVRFAPPADLDVEEALRRTSSRMTEADVLPLRPKQAKEPSRAPSRYTVIRIAAAVVLLAGGAVLWRSVVQRADDGSGPALAARTFETAPGRADTLELEDGTRVVLGPGSRLVTTGGYGGRTREVQLSGIALFEVVHDEARPFTVSAGGANVRDLGTVFTVSGAEGEEVRVVVTSGTVALAPAGVPAGREVTLEAGDRGVLPVGGEPVAERASATDADLAWTRGRLVLDNVPLERVAVEIRRWYGVELRFADAELGDRRLTATFEREPVDQVLSVIALTLGMRIERTGDIALLTGAPEER